MTFISRINETITLTPDETLHTFVAHKLYPELKQMGFRGLIREELDCDIGNEAV